MINRKKINILIKNCTLLFTVKLVLLLLRGLYYLKGREIKFLWS